MIRLPSCWSALCAVALVVGGCGGESFVEGPNAEDSDSPDSGVPSDAGSRSDAGQRPPVPDAGVVPPQCSYGESQSRACGLCASGLEQRVCGPDGRWGSWGSCQGEQTGFPLRLADETPLCPPYDRPAVFFAPHPDDEAIGMAGAIREHVLAGRPVVVELLTRGTGTGARNLLANGETCAWHSGSHTYALTPDQIGQARVKEFKDSLQQLGVQALYVSDFQDGSLSQTQAATRINWWIAHGGTGCALKGVAGPQDPTKAGSPPHPDHLAVWNALMASGFADVRGYLVYAYTSGVGTPTNTKNIATWCPAKGSALDAYRVWNPAAGRYAIGQHSVRALLDAAAGDCREFLVIP